MTFVADVIGNSLTTITPESDFVFAETAGGLQVRRLTAGF